MKIKPAAFIKRELEGQAFLMITLSGRIYITTAWKTLQQSIS